MMLRVLSRRGLRAPAVVALAFALAGLAACSRGQSSKAYAIGVVPKGTTHEFWKSIHAGAIKAARELDGRGIKVNITWKGPLREDDREQQVQVVEGFVSQGMDGIVLAPLDERALVRPIEEAKRAGIPTVIIDSDLASEEIVSASSPPTISRAASWRPTAWASCSRDKGKVLLLRYQEGSASTTSARTGSCSG